MNADIGLIPISHLEALTDGFRRYRKAKGTTPVSEKRLTLPSDRIGTNVDSGVSSVADSLDTTMHPAKRAYPHMCKPLTFQLLFLHMISLPLIML